MKMGTDWPLMAIYQELTIWQGTGLDSLVALFALGFFGHLYLQAETSEGRVDPFDPNNFKYEITAKELVSPAVSGA